MELYEHPRTRFVAEFIGSPKMNLIPAEVIEASATGAVVRTAAGETVQVGVDAASARAGQSVMLGARPEHLTLSGPGDGIRVKAAFVETLGHATYVYVSQAGSSETLTVQLSGDLRPTVGEALTLHIDPARAHLFDADGAAFRRL